MSNKRITVFVVRMAVMVDDMFLLKSGVVGSGTYRPDFFSNIGLLTLLSSQKANLLQEIREIL